MTWVPTAFFKLAFRVPSKSTPQFPGSCEACAGALPSNPETVAEPLWRNCVPVRLQGLGPLRLSNVWV